MASATTAAFRLGPQPATLAECLRRPAIAPARSSARSSWIRGSASTAASTNTTIATTPNRRRASFHFAERPADQVLARRHRVDHTAVKPATCGPGSPGCICSIRMRPTGRRPRSRAAGRRTMPRSRGPMRRSARRWRSFAARGQLDRTLVVVTADHGESLGDHGETTHGLFAYDATLRVPLIFSAPGPAVHAWSPHPRSTRTSCRPSSICSASHRRPTSTDARLRAEIDAAAQADGRPIYFEALDANLTRGWAPLRGVVDGKWKYIDLPDPELYDLDADPGERTQLVGREPERVARAPGPPARHGRRPRSLRRSRCGLGDGGAVAVARIHRELERAARGCTRWRTIPSVW